MMKELSFSKNLSGLIIVIAVLLLLGWGFLSSDALKTAQERSVEIGVVSFSPKGMTGGLAIPASCPSYEHTPGECAPPALSLLGSGGGGSGGAMTINDGACVTLDWNALSASLCSGVNFSTGGQISGSVSGLCPDSTTSYTLVCNYNPAVYTPSTLQSSVGVTVLHPVLNISANPVTVRSGRESTITWSATDVDSCTVTGPGGFSYATISGSALSGPITIQSTYILTCQNAGGELSASTVVTLIPSFEEF